MKITYDFGHGTGQDRGASGYRNEEHDCREYGALVIKKLQALGHTCYNCTPSSSHALTLGQSLSYRVNKANSYNSQLHICMHVNAFQTDKATGSEVEYASNSGKTYADRVSAEISTSLVLTNRGAKLQGGLYVLKYTNMPAILVEPFFCDNKSDCSKYNAEKLATAIVKGVTGIDTSVAPKVTPKPAASAVKAAPKYDESIPSGSNIFNIPNIHGYIEETTDGRLTIHKDRGNYVAIGKGFVDLYWNNNNGHGGNKRISG
ncbi:N-acetylmuramoyl-L-alanine amidase [Clostridium tyrobutyricum]|uniref:N-acetylmuramoyl-L-alanine amidase n=1 Tax=Clostridium tyrobutyricum TaxID=1519 RepID=UPI001C38D285|nr:N-acetylmuramoyl-L-alanine amidase [Clostridium tyrobutyricum]MBV4440191.1 N-acetylmuramoyl-L-alanine amidase [Clostridium tyrobutyricum]